MPAKHHGADILDRDVRGFRDECAKPRRIKHPAMPMTRSRGKSAAANATWHMASSGFETTTRIASGDCWTACSVTERTMPMLVRSKSSRLMPGLRAIPEVMTTTSDAAVSSYPLPPAM